MCLTLFKDLDVAWVIDNPVIEVKGFHCSFLSNTGE